MKNFIKQMRFRYAALLLSAVLTLNLQAQDLRVYSAKTDIRNAEENFGGTTVKPLLISVIPNYFNAQSGVSIDELIARAIRSNQDLAAIRLEVEKAKARLTQAKLRSNPTLEIEQQTGKPVGDGGNGQFTVGVSVPIEIYGRRDARINVAQLQIKASEAEIRSRQRVLTAEILSEYAEILAALREIDALEKVLDLDLQTTRFVQIRVNEGETAPLELNLLQTEVERLRARRQLVEGRLQASLTKLKMSVGIPFDEPLILREEITTAILPSLPQTVETATDIALKNRPEILLSEIEEQVATAGLRLIRASSKPDLTAYTRYTQGNSTIDLPTGEFPQNRSRSLTFGVSIGLPVFNKNQGAKAEAEIAIRQTQMRREFIERMIRSEILAAYQRFEAANRAVTTLQTSAIPRADANIKVFRQVYELGEIKITDLIAEQRRLLDATRDLTEALTQKYRAQADIHLAIGGDVFRQEK